MVDSLNTTAADFSINHYPAGKPANPLRLSLKVGSNNNATNILSEQSFEIQVQELRGIHGPARECSMLDDILNQVFLASASCSQQNFSNLPELFTYEVRLCTKMVGLN